jgi:hypothetical protein
MSDAKKGSSAEELQRLRAAADAELPEFIERAERRRRAMEEQNVSGQLRRAIADDGFRFQALAAAAGVSTQEIADFMTGDIALPSTAVDLLAAEMHQKLVAADSV